MGKKTHRFAVHDARRISHPTFPSVDKYWFTVPARDFPVGISAGANAREPVGLNRRVYRDVKDSLTGKSATPGTFDLMNKGITILADSVRLVDKDSKIYDVVIDDALGIVDGAHTAKLIEDAQTEEIIPSEQFVEVYIKTGVNSDLVADISKGLNTGMQVQTHSILNTDGVFDWLKAELQHQPYYNRISWKESDNGEYDVRDIVGVLECFNIVDFPNEEPKHPIAAYEKWSTPLESFGRDYAENFKKNKEPAASKYFRMRPLLVQALYLHDVIRRDFYFLHNETGGRAAKLKIVEVASEKKGAFDFPFAGLPQEKYRLTKGALFPILAAFRNCVVFNEPSKSAEWLGGFDSVIALWQKLGLELVAETRSAVKEIGSHPDQIGKSRSHWANLHKTVKLHVQEKRMQLLEQRLREQAA